MKEEGTLEKIAALQQAQAAQTEEVKLLKQEIIVLRNDIQLVKQEHIVLRQANDKLLAGTAHHTQSISDMQAEIARIQAGLRTERVAKEKKVLLAVSKCESEMKNLEELHEDVKKSIESVTGSIMRHHAECAKGIFEVKAILQANPSEFSFGK